MAKWVVRCPVETRSILACKPEYSWRWQTRIAELEKTAQWQARPAADAPSSTDVSRREPSSVVHRIKEEFGRLDVLFNNAA